MAKMKIQSDPKLKKITQQINRLNLKKNYLNSKIQTQEKQDRRARTRTLIQLGGLIEKSGLMNLVQIQTGDDLQLNHESFEKASILLEMLSETFLQFENHTEKQMQILKEKGISKMKKASYEKN